MAFPSKKLGRVKNKIQHYSEEQNKTVSLADDLPIRTMYMFATIIGILKYG